ncbi:MAG TPA: CDP-alcohol phosphatidyltransferase family protein [Kofleriaceae bacterium]|nr:CDP-alcohol phosphatidyltransferase family protein [Kofleriaceae bacterium]
MDRFYLLTPALVLLAIFLIAFLIYCGLHAVGRAPEVSGVKHNQLLGPFMAGFLVWLIGPVERVLVGRVSPNVVTATSLVLCAVTGVVAALGHLPRAVWLYAFAGILDVLDGRLARAAGKPAPSGALFDSVSDRWGELFVFAGFAWFMHDSAWLLAVLAAIAGSMMVSYTRARAEGLGVTLAGGGLMQRAERIVLVAGGTLVAAWYGADPDNSDMVVPILGVTMLVCGVAASATAINRWIIAHRELARREAEPTLVRVDPPVVPAPAVTRAAAPARKVAGVLD